MTTGYTRARADFIPIFERIATDARAREYERTLPFEQVNWLKEAGFGIIRIPEESGGYGLPFPQVMQLLTELAEADSNVAHVFRGHFYSVEDWLTSPDPTIRDYWTRLLTENRCLVGNAWSENNDKAVRQGDTRIDLSPSGTYVVNGKKDFSTGTIYAEFVDVLAYEDGVRTRVIVPTDVAGVERFDNWDGFGQRLSGTGKTTFVDVEVPAANVSQRLSGEANEYQTTVLQMVLLAALAGIARSAFSEIKDYLVTKTKPLFASSSGLLAKDDPLVHVDLGRMSAQIFAVEATLRVAAEEVERAYRATIAGEDSVQDASVKAIIATYQAQTTIIPTVLDVTTKALDDVGVTATSRTLGLDRHWRNARIISSHNPIRYRETAIGHHAIFAALPLRP